MRAYVTFVMKEFTELRRTYKLFIMLAVFLLVGMMNPLTAKLTPVILKSMEEQGMIITVPDPTAMDSWMQFFKNISTALIAFVIMFSGIMSHEYSKGTLVNLLTKGLPRRTVILAKFTSAVLLWTASYALCFFTTWGYTEYFWQHSTPPNLLFSVFCYWLFGVLITAILLLFATLFKSNYACMLCTGGFVIVLTIISVVPKTEKYNPLSLSSRNMELLSKSADTQDLTVPIIAAAVLCIAAIFLAIKSLNKKEI